MLETREETPLPQPAIHQFVKFCIVGASSFAIDLGVAILLHYYVHIPLIPAKTISFTLAVTNGFYWNRRWTFAAVPGRRQRDQYAMFFAVNIVGWLLNVGIVTVVIGLVTGIWIDQHPKKTLLVAATLVATVFVVFWNFFANRLWTFKH